MSDLYDIIRGDQLTCSKRNRFCAAIDPAVICLIIQRKTLFVWLFFSFPVTVVIKLSLSLMASQTFIVTPPRATLERFSAACKATHVLLGCCASQIERHPEDLVASFFVLRK